MKHSLLKTALIALGLSSAATAATYDLPFKGESFSDSEKLYTFDHAETTSQLYAFDISSRRYNTSAKRWEGYPGNISSNSRKNADSYIYNKPVYAMRSGKVISCWRNAPNNPRPKRSGDSNTTKPWLHADYRAGLIPGGGNMLWVEHSDGTRALYAHFVPGSVSSSLCPHSASVFPKKPTGGVSYTNVPAAQQATIVKGQYLGRVGNSGNSTGPHLHVHLQDGSGAGQVIKFNRGISAPLNHNSRYGSWSRFAGATIPGGNRLVWAPRTVRSQYVRHGFGSAGYQALFTHLSDSGYKPTWLDGYSVNDKVYYNMVWKPANISWRSYHGRTSSSYQSAFNSATAAGYVPVHVDSHLTSSGPRFSVIFEKKSKQFLARHNVSYSSHMAAMNQAKSLGLSPVSVSVVNDNNQLRYTTLYDKTYRGPWTIKSQLTSAGYQSQYTSQAADGKRPTYLNSYVRNGNVYYTAVFAKYPTRKTIGRHGATGSAFQSYFNTYTAQNYMTDIVAGIDGYSAHRFAGIWTKP